jgi:BrnA antitoxin of type II toxin-antitoxin system
MKREYDFSNAKRGPIVPAGKGKTRITIRIDDDILDWFRARVHKQGGGSYQTQINAALREYITRSEDFLAETIRQVVREEIAPYVAAIESPTVRRTKKRRGTA